MLLRKADLIVTESEGSLVSVVVSKQGQICSKRVSILRNRRLFFSVLKKGNRKKRNQFVNEFKISLYEYIP